MIQHFQQGRTGFLAKRLGFIGAGRRVEKVFKEFLKLSNLGGGEIDLCFQHKIAMSMRVEQSAFQVVFFKEVAVGPNFHFAASAQVGKRAEYGRVVPAVGLARKILKQVLHRRAHTIPVVVLDESKQLLLRFRQRCSIVCKQPLLGMLEVLGDIVFGVGYPAQHAQIWIGPRDEFMETARDSGLRIFSANLDLTAGHKELGFAQQAQDAQLKLRVAPQVLEALVGQDAFDRFLLSAGVVLADVFFRSYVHQDIAHESVIRRHYYQQLVPSHVL